MPHQTSHHLFVSSITSTIANSGKWTFHSLFMYIQLILAKTYILLKVLMRFILFSTPRFISSSWMTQFIPERVCSVKWIKFMQHVITNNDNNWIAMKRIGPKWLFLSCYTAMNSYRSGMYQRIHKICETCFLKATKYPCIHLHAKNTALFFLLFTWEEEGRTKYP